MRQILSIIICLFCSNLFAQELTVKSMTPLGRICIACHTPTFRWENPTALNISICDALTVGFNITR